MAAPALVFDPQAALTAVKSWAEFTLAALYEPEEIRRGRRNPPANSQRQVTVIPLTPTPRANGWTNVEGTAAQRNLVRVTVSAAAAGLWRVSVLGQDADYVAGGGDDEEAIRDNLRAAVDGLGLAATTDDVGDDAFTIQGDAAGVWLAAAVTPPAGGSGSVVVVDDVIRRVSWMVARWTLRIFIDDIRPRSGASSVTQAAQLLEQVLAAGQVPVVNGVAYQQADDILRDAGLSFVETLPSVVGDYTTGGTGTGGVRPTVWHERAGVDVVFRVTKGLRFDLPSIETFGAPTVTLSDP